MNEIQLFNCWWFAKNVVSPKQDSSVELFKQHLFHTENSLNSNEGFTHLNQL